jgi:hypothetical protein
MDMKDLKLGQLVTLDDGGQLVAVETVSSGLGTFLILLLPPNGIGPTIVTSRWSEEGILQALTAIINNTGVLVFEKESDA